MNKTSRLTIANSDITAAATLSNIRIIERHIRRGHAPVYKRIIMTYSHNLRKLLLSFDGEPNTCSLVCDGRIREMSIFQKRTRLGPPTVVFFDSFQLCGSTVEYLPSTSYHCRDVIAHWRHRGHFTIAWPKLHKWKTFTGYTYPDEFLSDTWPSGLWMRIFCDNWKCAKFLHIHGETSPTTGIRKEVWWRWGRDRELKTIHEKIAALRSQI